MVFNFCRNLRKVSSINLIFVTRIKIWTYFSLVKYHLLKTKLAFVKCWSWRCFLTNHNDAVIYANIALWTMKILTLLIHQCWKLKFASIHNIFNITSSVLLIEIFTNPSLSVEKWKPRKHPLAFSNQWDRWFGDPRQIKTNLPK